METVATITFFSYNLRQLIESVCWDLVMVWYGTYTLGCEVMRSTAHCAVVFFLEQKKNEKRKGLKYEPRSTSHCTHSKKE